METFGEWLRGQRNRRKLTARGFCRTRRLFCFCHCGSRSGERRPSIQIAELMANCLDVPQEKRSTFVHVARGELGGSSTPRNRSAVATPNISSPKTNLPIFPTPLIGREREVEQLGQLCVSAMPPADSGRSGGYW